ncbi:MULTISPECIES: hypothetical protein [Klebsiella]|uniref:Uncharacterized protein n=1 Tax=Klebsiella spallanzanii TaxID=2587528 RepID=A0A564JU60_9ENTR|nr:MULTISPECIES: hypothetical protein [Klebsiella]ELT1807366.1 hypothetical protein [Klebsiella michiganensis]MDV0340461.1 hypothetical protein [Klebsiella michiganensis]MDV0356248.1 hypothetical protein [Klebsiella michiganensis]MDV0404163.1 hypothetical protein [Klebsiella michiganensis]VUS61332.1 hypothetical protein SB6408_04978 [Klebsiella spallanzanii]
MYLKIKLIKGKGLVGQDPDTGKAYIINTGLSFTGVTSEGEKCSVINTARVESLQDVPERMIVIHGGTVLTGDLLIIPDQKWQLAEIR